MNNKKKLKSATFCATEHRGRHSALTDDQGKKEQQYNKIKQKNRARNYSRKSKFTEQTCQLWVGKRLDT